PRQPALRRHLAGRAARADPKRAGRAPRRLRRRGWPSGARLADAPTLRRLEDGAGTRGPRPRAARAPQRAARAHLSLSESSDAAGQAPRGEGLDPAPARFGRSEGARGERGARATEARRGGAGTLPCRRTLPLLPGRGFWKRPAALRGRA